MSRFEARLLGREHEPAWHAIWLRHGLPLGLHWSWVEDVARGLGKPVRVGVFSAGGELLAGAAFVERRKLVFTEWHHPGPVPFAGLLHGSDALNESSLREVLEALSRFVKQHCSLAEIVFQPGFDDVRGLLWDGWTALPHYNYTSRLAGADDLQAQAENSVRRQVRKASESGASFHSGNDQLEDLLRLWEETRGRQGLPAFQHEEAFRQIVKRWGGEPGEEGIGLSVHLVRSAEGASLAGALIGRHGERAYYLLGASSREAEGSGAPSLLHVEIARLLAAEGGRVIYDWVGANTPHVAQFKKKFRPGLECYHRARFETRLLGLLRNR